MTILVPYIIVCLIVEITPGPNMVYLAVLSMSQGRKAGFAAALGAATGLMIIGLITALGLAAVIAASATAYQILHWAGVVYLFWLAWEGWHMEEDPDHEKAQPTQIIKFFKRGLLTNILNPKAAVFYISILPGFIGTTNRIVLETTFLSVIYVIIATTIHLSIVILAGETHKIMRNSRRSLIFRRFLSLLLVFMALWLAWITRQPNTQW